MRSVPTLLVALCVALAGCGGSDFGGQAQSETSNGGSATGGSNAGGSTAGSGGRATGGHSSSTGGLIGSGGRKTGGATGAGGAATGGVGSGGAAAGGSGSGGVGAGGGTSTTVCGGLVGAQCPGDQWCDYPSTGGSDCGNGDVQGVCRDRPLCALAGASTPVCGCDGKPYANECAANTAGTDVSSSLSCYPDAGTAGTPCASDSNCGSGLKCCYPCGIPGCQNVCTVVNGSCPLLP